MRFTRVLLAAVLTVAGLGVRPGTALAASVPAIQGTQEVGTPGAGGRMLLVYGVNLTKVTAWELDESNGTLIAPLTVVFKGKTLTGLALPASLVPPTYTLPGNFSLKFTTKTATASVLIKLTGGFVEPGSVASPALDPALRTDLDDAVTVGGESLTDLHDSGLLTGSLTTDAFSAYDDLVVESKIGTGSTQVAGGNHNHDSRYPLSTTLASTGTINSGGNPVDWTQLKGVPAAFADGTDDGGGGAYAAGTGLTLTGTTFSVNFGSTATTVAAGNHNHDTSYYTQTQLNGAGTINTGSNPVDWTKLKNVPAGLADGTDADTTYAAGTGITLTGTTFSVNFGTTSTTVAAGDHTHTGYVASTGGTMTGTLTINDSTNQAIIATSGTTSATSGGIDCVTSGGIGVAGHGNIGVLGDLDSDGTWGVAGKCAYSYQVGVYAYANSGQYETTSTALFAYHFWYGTGIKAKSFGGTAIYAYTAYGSATVVNVRGNNYATGVRSNVGQGGTGVYSYAGYGGTGLYARSGNNGNGVKAYGGYGGTGVYARAGTYGTGIKAYGGYRGTGIRTSVSGSNSTGLVTGAYGNYATGVLSRAYGYNSYGIKVNAGNTRNLAVFQYYGSNQVRFDFKGNGYFNSGTTTGGADFAESVKVDQPVEEFEPGDVMIIDIKSPRQFALSRDANSTLVAGVISTKPAVVGSAHDVATPRGARKLKDEVKLGIVGIVPTKVCDEGGEIRIGDLLVTASVHGHAMKAPANPAVGTVIGKALGALDRGSGKIEVLLMAR